MSACGLNCAPMKSAFRSLPLLAGLLALSPVAAFSKPAKKPTHKPGPKTRTTASGLKITDLKIGMGAKAVAGKIVTVNYRGTLTNGQLFDQSYGKKPFDFPLGAHRVIAGWDEGVAGMKVGGKRKLVIPPALGYGDQGAGGVIPPGATLIFTVELLEVK